MASNKITNWVRKILGFYVYGTGTGVDENDPQPVQIVELGASVSGAYNAATRTLVLTGLGDAGATGATGPAGNTWAVDSLPPEVVTNLGDLFLNDSTGAVYQVQDNGFGLEWVEVTNIKGPTGAAGPTGATGATGGTGATGATGAAGVVPGLTFWPSEDLSDMSLPSDTGTAFSANNSNPDTFTRSSGTWSGAGALLAGQIIKWTGWGNGANNASFPIVAATTTSLTLTTSAELVSESGSTATYSVERKTLKTALDTDYEEPFSRTIVLADGDVAIRSYITPMGVPSTNVLPAGDVVMYSYAYVSSATATVTKIKWRCSIVHADGTETEVFTTSASTITSTSTPELVTKVGTIASPIAMETTDRLQFTILANTSTSTARTIYHMNGGAHASKIVTTLPIPGPQGMAKGHFGPWGFATGNSGSTAAGWLQYGWTNGEVQLASVAYFGVPAPYDGFIHRVSAYHGATNANAITYTLYVNGSATSVTVTVGSGLSDAEVSDLNYPIVKGAKLAWHTSRGESVFCKIITQMSWKV